MDLIYSTVLYRGGESVTGKFLIISTFLKVGWIQYIWVVFLAAKAAVYLGLSLTDGIGINIKAQSQMQLINFGGVANSCNRKLNRNYLYLIGYSSFL